MICAHNYVCNFDFYPAWHGLPIFFRLPKTHSLTFWLTETAHTLSLSHILTSKYNSLSLFISTSRNSLTLPVSKTQFNTRNMGAYTFCNIFLSCSAFSVRLLPASNAASEISSKPERDKQQTWKKTRSSQNTLLYFCILIPRMKYLVNIHFIIYRTLLIPNFCVFEVDYFKAKKMCILYPHHLISTVNLIGF